MSLILEALRKSEAERRRGLPPDLHAELPPTPAARRRALPLWWWLVAGFAALALAWWLSGQRDADPPAPAPVASAQRADRVVADPATAEVLPARTPSATAPSPAIAAPPELATPIDTVPAPSSRPEPQAPAPPATTAPAAPAAPTSPPDPGRVLSLGELDADTRKALPPLRLSMHLWNEDPARRFVILDGQRLVEGDRVGEAAVVRIERDGVLLEWNGRGIRVPVR